MNVEFRVVVFSGMAGSNSTLDCTGIRRCAESRERLIPVRSDSHKNDWRSIRPRTRVCPRSVRCAAFMNHPCGVETRLE